MNKSNPGNPKVSIVMSVFNGEKYLRKSLESILNQTLKDFEFLIINDGSTDKSVEILEEYAKKDARIRLVHQGNMGLTKSLNKGLKLAKGDYIARMDTDDVSMPSRLEKQIKFLEKNPQVVLLGSWVEIIDGYGNIKGITKYPTDHCIIAWILLFRNCLAHPTVMYRREEVLKIGAYNSTLKYTQDYDLWIRLSKIGEISQIPEVLLKLRKHGDSIEGRYEAQQVAIARSIAYDYAKCLTDEINEDVFYYFYEKTKGNSFTYRQVKEIVSFTWNMKNNFLKINSPDLSCEQEITKDIKYWFKEWALKNRKNPLIYFYLFFSGIKTG